LAILNAASTAVITVHQMG